MRKKIRIQNTSGIAQCDPAAIVFFNQLGMSVSTTAVINSIQVSDKTDCPALFIAWGSRQKSVCIGVLIHRNIGESQILHLLRQEKSQFKLPLAGRGHIPVFIAGRIDQDIFQ